MAAKEESHKETNKSNKYDEFIGSFGYRNDLPNTLANVKLLPNGAKSLMDYTIDPVSFPEQETQYDFNLKGLYQVFDIDLLSHNPYEPPMQSGQMDPRDSALLADIVDPNMPIPRPISVQPLAMRPKSKPREHLSVQPFGIMQRYQSTKQQLDVDALSVEQQQLLINQTFVDINKPLFVHPTRAGSKAHPIAVLPVFPDSQHSLEFVHVKFGIPPNIKGNCVLKDCGNFLINFKEIPDQPAEAIQCGIKGYVTDQRFKEDHNSEAERFEHIVLQERNGHVYYQMVSNQLRLRKERPTADSHHSLCLLQMQYKKPKTD